ncbi:FAD-binding domain-containing protein [Psychrobacter sp.]|uniref:cryptochrome/photolyase family protein n=1 Tax=Psychrobacter sp. TaxID=56811 RepID=UPI0025D1C567|nr:FAD-binding domain-containing protein [Psychrobacter sp.]
MTSYVPTIEPIIKPKKYLMWFRRDLRVHDNTALTMLFDDVNQILSNDINESVPPILAVYTITPKQWLEHDMSLVQMDFIFRTLKQLATTLFIKLGIPLKIINSDTFTNSVTAIKELCTTQSITHVFANIEYESNEQARDSLLDKLLDKHNIKFNRYHDQCILTPNTIKTGDDSMYKVFTPFYKKWQSILEASPVQVYPVPVAINKTATSSDDEHLKMLLKTIDSYHEQTIELFKLYYGIKQSTVDAILKNTYEDYPAGESQAQKRLKEFVKEDIVNYNTARDKPALMATSQMSAYLTVGSISARVCYHQANKLLNAFNQANTKGESETSQTDIERWISELAWRDFYRHVISYRPDILKGSAYKIVTDKKVEWSYDNDDFKKWCEGRTGVPLVDAAMRCLNATGFMHNRLRMVTAMFLTKDLLIDWRLGERYFMQHLIDGDFASNNGGWQWSASTGVDASPYFRIMNPFSQAKTHDEKAIFIKTWLPELRDMPPTILHDEAKLRQALSTKGKFANVDYPQPMVEHKQARLYAIQQFKQQ